MKIKNRPKKEKRTYEKLIEAVCEKWDDVVAKCPQAKRFDEDVRRFLIGQNWTKKHKCVISRTSLNG